MKRPTVLEIDIPLSEKELMGPANKHSAQSLSKLHGPKSTTNASISSSKYMDTLVGSTRTSVKNCDVNIRTKDLCYMGLRDTKTSQNDGIGNIPLPSDTEGPKYNTYKNVQRESYNKKPQTTKHTSNKFDFLYDDYNPMIANGYVIYDEKTLIKPFIDKFEGNVHKNITRPSNFSDKHIQILKEKLTAKGISTFKKITTAQRMNHEHDKLITNDNNGDPDTLPPKTSPNAIGKTRELFITNNRLIKNANNNVENRYIKVDEDTKHIVNRKTENKINPEFSFADEPVQENKHESTKRAKDVHVNVKTQSKFCENNIKPNTTTNINSKKIIFDVSKEGLSQQSNINAKSPKSQSRVEGLVRYDKIPNWKIFCNKLRDLEIFLNAFLNSIEKLRNPYDIVRQYVDYIQETTFNEVADILTQARYRKAITQSFILERWAIFIVFYLSLEHGIKHNKKVILRLALTIYQNFIFYLKLLYGEKHYFTNKEELKVFKSFLDESILPKNADFYAFRINKIELLDFIEKANVEIKDFLISITNIMNNTISVAILKLMDNIQDAKINENLGFLLDSFCEYFIKKGVVTVEFGNNEIEMQNKQTMPKIPFIRNQIHNTREYTLILDLDETLVHYDQKTAKNQVLLRPHVHRFLDEMAKYFEIIVFTAAQQDYADWVIDRLDKGRNISYRLYRQHTCYYDNTNIKDLDKVGRDIRKTIIVDNIAENFQLQNDNGIFIKSWFHDPSDTVLLKLMPFLRG